MSSNRIIFIVPCFNEEKRLKSDDFLLFCIKNPLIDFCFVDNGSKDGTLQILEKMQSTAPTQIKYLQLSHNQGKSEAVRQGMLYVCEQEKYDYIGYLDADLATPLSEIIYFKDLINDKPGLILVAGSRISRMGASIDRYWIRHYFGRIFATIVSQMLQLPFYDTQCGAKLLKSNIVKEVFAYPFISPWLFDIELIFRILKIDTNPSPAELIYELPLSIWKEQGGSKIRPKDLIRIPVELLKIWKKYK
jgi:glycosyltransferase involved in cell wall biosynthesis